jgi:methionyl-tRNA formyltransferase
MSAPLQIVFAGTPQFAAVHLESLIAGPHHIKTVMSQPDRPAGRGKRLQPSPVKALALEAGLPVWQPESLKTPESRNTLADLQADILVVVAYGLILPADILAIPQLGCLNVHASLLPRWRGAAPVQRAIEAGDHETGVSIMLMEPGLDTGPVLLTSRMSILAHHTSGTLLEDLAASGAQALSQSLEQIGALLPKAKPQNDSLATYAHKITKQETALDWSCSAPELARRIRAFQPAPGCHAFVDNERVKVIAAHATEIPHVGVPGEILAADESGLQVACREGVLVITQAQFPGAKAQPVSTLLNGHRDRLRPGKHLTSTSAG